MDDAQPLAAPMDFSVVIPFHNPGEHLRTTVQDLLTCLDEGNLTSEVIVVDDGSTDGSASSLAGLDPRVRLIVLPDNRGKGAALRIGLSQARGVYVGMIDSDGDIDPHHLLRYRHIAESGDYQVVAASRYVPASVSQATASRKAMSRTFSAMVGTLFSLTTRDTQVGCKVFQADALARVLPLLQEERFAFDLEFFVVAHQLGIDRIYEAPVELNERIAGSTVGASSTARMVKDTLHIFGRLHFSDAYESKTRAQRKARKAPVSEMSDTRH